MTAEARQWRNTLRWSTNDDFFQTLSQQWALSPRDISCYHIPGFTPSAARLVHNNIISKEVCRVFVLRCHSASHLTCFVSSSFTYHMQLYSRTVIYSLYSHTSHIHSYINTIIHSYINTFIHQCIYSMHTNILHAWLHC